MFGAVILLAVGIMGGTLPTPLYAIYQKDIGFSHVVLTLVYAAYVIGTLAVLLGLGRVSDQLGRRRTVDVGLAVGLVGSAIFFLFPHDLAALYAGRVASGLSVGLISGAATAWISELEPGGDRGRGALWAAVGNVAGIGVGPFTSGLVADVAPAPLQVPYLVLAAVFAVSFIVAARTRETVVHPVALGKLALRPRIGVPREILGPFIAPTLASVAIFAVFGFYSAIEPSFLRSELQQPSHALAGGIVLELSAFSILGMAISRRLPSRAVLLGGLALLVAGLGLVVLAQNLRSLAAFVVATAVAGLGFGPGYRGSLELVNRIAPDDRRAEVLSTYFVFSYLGLSVPIVGIGVLAQVMSPAAANAVFAATVGSLGLLALALCARQR